MVREVVIYIHGVTPRGQHAHQWQYAALHEALRTKIGEAFPSDFCGVEWGWAAPGAPARSHQLLASAEERMGARAITSVGDASDFTLNPLRVAVNKFRGLMIYGLADMFYYVSEDGKSAVRYAVAQAVVKYLKPLMDDPQAQISLTLFGHSAGSVVAYDLLFYLFYKERKVQSFIDTSKVKAPASDAASVTDASAAKMETLGDLQRLKAMAQLGSLRVRRLFTFGSPITPLAFRSDAVLSILARQDGATKPNRLTAEHYGLTVNPEAFGSQLDGPRWINFWDKDDPIAWPVTPLMLETPDVIRDVYIDVSDDITNAHNEYWESEKFHENVSKAW